jgi:hypothetical protein
LRLRSRRRLWRRGSKPYCYKLMRLNVPIGCMINARDAASPANAQLGRGSVSSCFDIKTTTHNRKSSVGFAAVPEVQRSRVESSADATSANVGAANGNSVRTWWLSLLNFKLAPLRFAQNGKPSFFSPKIHRPNLTISLATPIECVSICFAIFPGGVSQPKGNFSTLSAYTLTKYRWVDPGGGQGPPYPFSP